MIEMPRVTWTELKAFVDQTNASIKYFEFQNRDHIYAYDGDFVMHCRLRLDPADSSDIQDWQDNYKSSANKKFPSQEVSGVQDPKGMRARLTSLCDETVTQNTTQDLDWQIDQLNWLGVNKQSYFDGIEYYAKDANIGDCVTFQIVDKDGLVYPAGTILEEFGKDWKIFPDTLTTVKLYKAKLIVGMYIRVKYTSTSTTTDPRFVCNIFRHLNDKENV